VTRFTVGTFVRVLARNQNHGKLGLVVEARARDVPPASGQVWIEMANPDPYGGVYRTLYHVNSLRVADELDTQG
jgi:hypothetical protein